MKSVDKQGFKEGVQGGGLDGEYVGLGLIEVRIDTAPLTRFQREKTRKNKNFRYMMWI